jgi:putative ABC transport system permease protein
MRLPLSGLGNLRRSYAKLALPTIWMICAGSAILVDASLGAEPVTKKTDDRKEIAIIVQQRGAKQRSTSVLDVRIGKEIERIPGVTSAAAGLIWFTSLEELSDDAVVVNGWEADSLLMKRLDIVAGRHLRRDDTQGVLLGERLAAALEKKVGDRVQIGDGAPCTVIGIFRSSATYELRSVVMSLADLQRVTGRKGQVTGFAVSVEHPENRAEVDRIIKAITAIRPAIDAKRAVEPPVETRESAK